MHRPGIFRTFWKKVAKKAARNRSVFGGPALFLRNCSGKFEIGQNSENPGNLACFFTKIAISGLKLAPNPSHPVRTCQKRPRPTPQKRAKKQRFSARTRKIAHFCQKCAIFRNTPHTPKTAISRFSKFCAFFGTPDLRPQKWRKNTLETAFLGTPLFF